ncbi:hypothetical protein FDP41_009645 [Naegleria fowleri]|uniref:Uncharacterized protein n=1 Tax=Naegleria fowleri TaxID=5763 RepID=A0A6A5BFV8_NAEFO|nr:uncharacterized protein FDP41_009645 [Naegleria fowleri]KAF0971949.1 hypothetical protein FDP41_009645 [Naegleria fowleri]CAG4709072.1 unnamed protein product [Naegleria fowleri]
MSRKAVEDVMRIEVEILDATRGTNSRSSSVADKPVALPTKIKPPKLDLQAANINTGSLSTRSVGLKSPPTSGKKSRNYTNSTTAEIYPPIASNVDIVAKKYTTKQPSSSNGNDKMSVAERMSQYAKQSQKQISSSRKKMNNSKRGESASPPSMNYSLAPHRSPKKSSSSPRLSLTSPTKSDSSGKHSYYNRPQSSPAGLSRSSFSPPKPVREHPNHIINTNIPLYTPGPGAYNVETATKYLRPSTAVSIARNPRFKDVGETGPGPNQYDPQKPLKRMPSPRFGSSKRPEIVKSITPGPGVYSGNDSFLSQVKTTPRFSFPHTPREIESEHRTPSPTSYAPKYEVVQKKNPTVAFTKSPKHERPKSTSAYTPGPGNYGIPNSPKLTKTPAFSFPKSERLLDHKKPVDALYNAHSSTFSSKGPVKFGTSKRFPTSNYKPNVPFYQAQPEWRTTKGGTIGRDKRNILQESISRIMPGPGSYTPNFSATERSTPKPVLYLTG